MFLEKVILLKYIATVIYTSPTDILHADYHSLIYFHKCIIAEV